MIWSPPPSGKRGHQQAYSDAAIQVCLTLKVQFGMPLREVTGFVESLVGLSRLNWTVPDYTTLCRRQKTLRVDIPYLATGAMHFCLTARLMPWDHAADVLIHSEAGGHAALLDSTPYAPTIHRIHLRLAPAAQRWEHLANNLGGEQ